MIKNRIRELRARHQMKQEELARRVGVRRETIGNLEKGRYNPSLVLAWKSLRCSGCASRKFLRSPKKRKKAGRRIDAQTKIEYNLWVTRQDDSGRGGTFA